MIWWRRILHSTQSKSLNSEIMQIFFFYKIVINHSQWHNVYSQNCECLHYHVICYNWVTIDYSHFWLDWRNQIWYNRQQVHRIRSFSGGCTVLRHPANLIVSKRGQIDGCLHLCKFSSGISPAIITAYDVEGTRLLYCSRKCMRTTLFAANFHLIRLRSEAATLP